MENKAKNKKLDEALNNLILELRRYEVNIIRRRSTKTTDQALGRASIGIRNG